MFVLVLRQLTSSYYTFMMDLTGELLFHPQIKKDFIVSLCWYNQRVDLYVIVHYN